MKKEDRIEKSKDFRNLAWSMAIHSSASILGPIIFFGAIGLYLDKTFGTKPKLLLASIAVAFVTTNILLFRKVRIINKWMADYSKKEAEKKSQLKEESEKNQDKRK